MSSELQEELEYERGQCLWAEAHLKDLSLAMVLISVLMLFLLLVLPRAAIGAFRRSAVHLVRTHGSSFPSYV